MTRYPLCAYGNLAYVLPFDKSTSLSNSFTGFSDQAQMADYNQNGILGDQAIIDKNTGNCIGGDCASCGEELDANGQPMLNFQGLGDVDDAFNSTVSKNMKISLSTNPAPMPVYTYVANPYNEDYIINGKPTGIDSWENRTIWLNGISVEILQENVDANGAVKVKVRFDDYKVENNVRWCGNIILSPNDFDATQYSLNLKTGKSILLDRGTSPTQHKAYDTDPAGEYRFTQPTVFTCLPNFYFHLEGTGRTFSTLPTCSLVVQNQSEMILQSNSTLEADKKSIIIVKGSGSASLTMLNIPHKLNNLKFVRKNTPLAFTGIILNGYTTDIDGVTIDGATIGIQSNSTLYGSSPELKNMVFRNCTTGLLSKDKGLKLVNSLFEKNRINWKGDGMSQPCTLKNVIIRQTLTGGNGITLIGSQTSPLYVESSAISSNYYDAFIKGSPIKVKCGSISNNTVGLFIGSNASLEMGMQTQGLSALIPSAVNAIGNNRTIECLNARSLYLNCGFNNLVPNPDDNESQNILNGYFNQTTNTIKAKRNKWSNFSNSNKPTFRKNYYLYYYKRGTKENPIIIVPVTVLDNSPINNIPVCNGQINDPSCLLRTANCPSCRKIHTPDFPDEKINRAIEFALKNLEGNEVLAKQTIAIDQLNQILMFDLPNPTDEEKELKDYGYLQMLQALGKMFELKKLTKDDNRPVLALEVQKVMEVQDKMILESSNGQDDHYFRHFFTLMEKAQTLRLADLRDLAPPLFDQAILLAKQEERPLAESWKCTTELEEQMLTGQIDPAQFLGRIDQNSCVFEIPNNNFSQRTNRNNILPTDSLLTENEQTIQTIYPNPASDNGIVHFQRNNLKGELLLEVYTMIGIKVLEYHLPENQEVVQLETSLLPQGIYISILRNNKNFINIGKLIIEK